ncbi:winged helix-turn-helix domain-containing protein [Natronobeatus ordinarius]|uniref:winged helix-turn-helix domain-containing protein n=1 Tax=Natronobeatus ordinarius TaxID=2963433 RepID=UPI0020CEC84C|nr:helix-turn-helix domain-containing protein [Natronobeatus ordinarius]
MSDMGDDIDAIDEVFHLLANETRMQIMHVLWERFSFSAYVTESHEGIAYSELLAGAGAEDSGNFNYHLGQLTGTLVEKRTDGYVLTPLGYNLMRSIERYSSFEYETRPKRPLEEPCPFCGGELVGEYRREIVSVRCQDCDGLADDGNFTFVQIPASGATDLSMAALVDVATLELFSKVTTAGHGFCWSCHAPIDCSIDGCESHERTAAGSCERCGQRFHSLLGIECDSCGTSGQGPLLEYVLTVPAVSAFFESAGVGPRQVGPWRYRLAAFGAVTETVVDTDPVIVEFSFSLEDRSCSVTVGEDFTLDIDC